MFYFKVAGCSLANFKVKTLLTTRYELFEAKKEFIEMRDAINELDDQLSYILLVRTGVTIYMVMINIYLVAVTHHISELVDYNNLLAFITISLIFDTIGSTLVCGSVHQKAEQIYAVLDSFNCKDLSHYEFRDWLMFKAVSREKSFGFTIGGFALLRKTTLISVCITITKYCLINR